MSDKPYTKTCRECGGPAFDCATRCHRETFTYAEVKGFVSTAREVERERIIKLLESIRVGDDWIGRDYAIELIKGENK